MSTSTPLIVMDTFGNRLASLRRRHNLSQDELAKSAELSRNYISLLEGNKREPSLTTLMKLRKALRTPLSALVPEQEPESDGEHTTWSDLAQRIKQFSPEQLAMLTRIIDSALQLGRDHGGNQSTPHT